MSGGVLPIPVRGSATPQDRRQRSTFYRPPTTNQLQHYLTQIPEDFQMCSKVWEEIDLPPLVTREPTKLIPALPGSEFDGCG